ncbi:MAG: hypothetical protein M1455_08170 [Actinobacteria bacterium]|nr:hypothetical protein [Actinomycetota bacterium]
MAGLFVIVLIGFGIATLIRLSGRPKEEDVLERWSALLPGQAISGGEFLLQVEQELTERNPEFKQSQMDFMGKLGAKGGEAIKVSHDMVHSCFIGYEVVGKDLHLNYALHLKKSVFYAIPFFGWVLAHMLNVVYLHERNKLIAFSAVTLDCVRKVTENLSDELGLSRDDVKIKAASGVLGPL